MAHTSQIAAQLQINCGFDRKVFLTYGDVAAYVGPYIGYARKSPAGGQVHNMHERISKDNDYLREYGSGRS